MAHTTNNLTTQPEYVTGEKESVIFLTEPAKKKLIEELKKLEAIKRNLFALLK